MPTTIITSHNQRIASVTLASVIATGQDILDLLMTTSVDTDCDRIALPATAFPDDFFVLSTGLAGELLQKCVNYRFKIAIYGDYSQYTSVPLQAFIRESNRGNSVFFPATLEEAVEMLAQGYSQPT